MIRNAQSATVRAQAAAFVNAGAVAYLGGTSSGAAAFNVTGRTAVYRVTVARAACRLEDCACNCRWAQHGGRACSHVRAVRLAWQRAALDYAKRQRAALVAAAAAAPTMLTADAPATTTGAAA